VDLLDTAQAARDRRARLEQLRLNVRHACADVATCLDCALEPTNITCPDCPCSTRFTASQLIALTWSVDD